MGTGYDAMSMQQKYLDRPSTSREILLASRQFFRMQTSMVVLVNVGSIGLTIGSIGCVPVDSLTNYLVRSAYYLESIGIPYSYLL